MEQEGSDEEKLKQQQDQPQAQPQPPEIQTAAQNHRLWQSPQKCPSCDSSNIKFCYYNNYSLSQPRYFCKACRRYWTHGGTLRNVLVGGDRRQKSKRLKPSSSGSEIGRTQSVSTTLPSQTLTGVAPAPPVTMSMGTADTGGSVWYSLLTKNLPAGIDQTRPIPPRPLTFLPQSLINRGPTTASSAASSSLWSGATADGSDNQASSSVDPNHWADNVPGFDPSPRT